MGDGCAFTGAGFCLCVLATQVQARNQQRAAGEGQCGLLLVITHVGESSSSARRNARSRAMGVKLVRGTASCVTVLDYEEEA